MTRCNWCGLESETSDICAWCKRPLANRSSFVPSKSSIHLLAESEEEESRRFPLGIIVSCLMVLGIFTLVAITALKGGFKEDKPQVASNVPPQDPEWSAPGGYKVPVYAPAKPGIGDSPVGPSTPPVTVNPTETINTAPRPLALSIGEPEPSGIFNVQRQPAIDGRGTIPIGFGNNSTVYIESVHLMPVTDSMGRPRIAGSVVIVNSGAEEVRNVKLSLVVNYTIYPLMEYLGNVDKPKGIGPPLVPAHSSLEVPVMSKEFDARTKVVTKKYLRFEGVFFGQGIFDERELGTQ